MTRTPWFPPLRRHRLLYAAMTVGVLLAAAGVFFPARELLPFGLIPFTAAFTRAATIHDMEQYVLPGQVEGAWRDANLLAALNGASADHLQAIRSEARAALAGGDPAGWLAGALESGVLSWEAERRVMESVYVPGETATEETP